MKLKHEVEARVVLGKRPRVIPSSEPAFRVYFNEQKQRQPLMRKARVVDATLTGNSGDFYLVSLIAPAEEYSHGSEEVGEAEDQPVTRFEVLDKIPDGEYILEYFSPRPFRGKARVVNGTLQIL